MEMETDRNTQQCIESKFCIPKKPPTYTGEFWNFVKRSGSVNSTAIDAVENIIPVVKTIWEDYCKTSKPRKKKEKKTPKEENDQGTLQPNTMDKQSGEDELLKKKIERLQTYINCRIDDEVIRKELLNLIGSL